MNKTRTVVERPHHSTALTDRPKFVDTFIMEQNFYIRLSWAMKPAVVRTAYFSETRSQAGTPYSIDTIFSLWSPESGAGKIKGTEDQTYLQQQWSSLSAQFSCCSAHRGILFQLSLTHIKLAKLLLKHYPGLSAHTTNYLSSGIACFQHRVMFFLRFFNSSRNVDDKCLDWDIVNCFSEQGGV